MDRISGSHFVQTLNSWKASFWSNETVQKISSHAPACFKNLSLSYLKNNKWACLTIVVGGTLLAWCILKIRSLNSQLSKTQSEITRMTTEKSKLREYLAAPIFEVEQLVSEGNSARSLEDIALNESAESLIEKHKEYAKTSGQKDLAEELKSFVASLQKPTQENDKDSQIKKLTEVNKELLDLLGELKNTFEVTEHSSQCLSGDIQLMDSELRDSQKLVRDAIETAEKAGNLSARAVGDESLF